MKIFDCKDDITFNHRTLASSQGIFHIVNTPRTFSIIDDKVFIHTSELHYDKSQVKLKFILNGKDDMNWRNIVDVKISNGIHQYAMYNDELNVIDYTLYPNLSVQSLQNVIGTHGIVFVDTEIPSEPIDVNTPINLIHITKLLKYHRCREDMNKHEKNVKSNNRLFYSLFKHLDDYSHYEISKCGMITTIDTFIFSPISLIKFMNVYEGCTESEKQLIREYIVNVSNFRNDETD